MVLGRLVSKIIDFVTLLVLTRLLQPADFGLVAMGMTLVLVVDSVLELPLSQALLRLREAGAAAYDTAFTLSIVRGLVVAVLIAALSQPIAAFYDEPRLVSLVCALAFGPALRGLQSPRLIDLQRQLDFRWSAAIEVVGKVAALLAASVLAVMTRSYWALAAAGVATSAVMALTSFIVAPYRPRLRLSDWHEFSDMMGWHSLSQLITAFNWQLDKFVLGRYTDSVALGQFFMAESVAAIPNNAIVAPISRPLMASYARIIHDREQLKAEYCKGSGAIFMFGAPPLLMISLLAEPLIRIAFAPNWLPAARFLMMLSLGNVLLLPTEPIAGLAMALNRTRVITLRSFVNFLVRLPATLLGVYYFGVFGALAARVFANLAVHLFSMFLMTRLIGVSARDQLVALRRPSLPVFALCGALLLLEPLLKRVPDGVALVAATGSVACIAAGVFIATSFASWHWAGRPPGAEAFVFTRFNAYRLKLLRR
jgi:O-antigen/teichoic acid export membrane protein